MALQGAGGLSASHQEVIALACLAGTHTRQVKKVLFARFKGAVREDVVRRAWRGSGKPGAIAACWRRVSSTCCWTAWWSGHGWITMPLPPPCWWPLGMRRDGQKLKSSWPFSTGQGKARRHGDSSLKAWWERGADQRPRSASASGRARRVVKRSFWLPDSSAGHPLPPVTTTVATSPPARALPTRRERGRHGVGGNGEGMARGIPQARGNAKPRGDEGLTSGPVQLQQAAGQGASSRGASGCLIQVLAPRCPPLRPLWPRLPLPAPCRLEESEGVMEWAETERGWRGASHR